MFADVYDPILEILDKKAGIRMIEEFYRDLKLNDFLLI